MAAFWQTTVSQIDSVFSGVLFSASAPAIPGLSLPSPTGTKLCSLCIVLISWTDVTTRQALMHG